MLEWDRIYLTFENKCKTHRKSPANIRFKAAAKFTAGYFLLGRHRWPSDLKIILILSSPSTRPIVYGSGWEHKSLWFLPPHEHRKNYRRWQDITDKCFHAVSGMRKSVLEDPSMSNNLIWYILCLLKSFNVLSRKICECTEVNYKAK